MGRTMSTRLALFVAFLVMVAVSGCMGGRARYLPPNGEDGDGDADADSDGDAEGDADGPRPVFDLGATAEEEGFYDHPYPSDTRVTSAGAPDLSSFYSPVNVLLLDDVADAIARDIRGFSQSAAVYFRFTAPLDAAVLPGSPEESVEPEATAFVVDVDPGSPHRGERWPVEVTFYEDGGRYFVSNMLALRPPLAMPLRAGTTYAAVVTRGVRGIGGEPALPEPAFDALLGEAPPSGREAEWEAMQPLAALAREQGFDGDLLVATVFTAADHLGVMRRVRRWLHEQVPAPVASEWIRVAGPEGGLAHYTGRFEMMELLSGEAPFMSPGEGVILFDDAGDPLPGRTVSLRFALTIPAGEAPPGGWPIALYAHGAGGDYQSFADAEGIWAARAGVAMISIDNPMHGDRNPDGSDFVDYLVQLAVLNPAAGREMYRHGIVDHVQLARLVTTEGFAVPADVSHTEAPIGFDTSRLAFVGHSMGSQIGTMLVAVEPLLQSAFFSEGGGGAAEAMVLSTGSGIDLEAMVALVLGIDLDEEPLGPDHPVVGLLLQTLLDPTDPLAYAYGAIRDPADAPVSIAMTEGLEDDQTVPTTIEALAAAYGIPIVEPVAQASRAHELWGIDSVPPPAQGNVTLGPEPVTGGVVQLPGHGHYGLYDDTAVQAVFREWLASGAVGLPLLEGVD